MSGQEALERLAVYLRDRYGGEIRVLLLETSNGYRITAGGETRDVPCGLVLRETPETAWARSEIAQDYCNRPSDSPH